MASDWQFDFVLSAQEREIVLYRLRGMHANCPADSPLAPVIGSFADQVDAGQGRIRLDLGALDTVCLVHLSRALSYNLSPAFTRCLHCGTADAVRMPRPATELAFNFDNRYSLSQLSPPDREWYLDQPVSQAARDRKAAADRAEAERRRDSIRRGEAASMKRILPGTTVEDQEAIESDAQWAGVR